MMNINEENNFQYGESIYTGENENTKKENLVFGIVGALLGSLIGVLLWVGIYSMGYIAAISGLVMVICGFKGYEMFAGGLSKKGVIATVIITIVMVYVSTHISYGLDIYNAFKDSYEITIFDGIRSVTSFVSEYPEIKSGFIKDLLMGYGFTALGAFSTVKNMLNKDGASVREGNI